jgi:hypothetical protein
MNMKAGAPGGSRDKEILRGVIRPGGRNVAQAACFIGIEQSIFTPAIAQLNSLKRPASKRVEGVYDMNGSWLTGPIECIRR